jgi:hypothetical protein
MGTVDAVVAKVTDPYERKARLYPALLAMLPLLVMAALLYGTKTSAMEAAMTVAISYGGLYLMTNLCREWGKRLEEGLYRGWGGKPTTQLLRHRDNTIEAPTKKRYHAFLASKINETFPDARQENENLEHADAIYQSGVRWLLNHTRQDGSKNFELLFSENIAYGFRRNALGIKAVGLIISFGCTLWTLAREHVITPASPFFDANAFTRMPDMATASLIISAVMAFMWMFFFTRASVRTAAFTYAEMLLRACDVLGAADKP